MERKMVRRTCVALLLVCSSLTMQSRAYAGAAIGATEPTQILNQLQLLSSYFEQIETVYNTSQTVLNTATQIQQEIENRAREALQPFYTVKQSIDDVRDVVKQGLGLAYSVENLDTLFTDRYKSFDDFMAGYERVDFVDDIREWTKTTEDSIVNALTGAGIQLESIEEEELIMEQLNAKAAASTSRQQAADVANEIASITVNQLQSLRQLIATDMQIKGAYFQQETAIRKQSEAAATEFFEPVLVPEEPLPNLDTGTTFGFGGTAGAVRNY